MSRRNQLRTVVVVQRATKASTAGEPIDTWGTLCTRRARQVTSGGTESEWADRTDARASVILELRWDSVTSTITPADRVLIDGRRLEIEAAEDVDGRRRTMRLTCTEFVS